MTRFLISSILLFLPAASLISQNPADSVFFSKTNADSVVTVKEEKMSYADLMEYLGSSVIVSDSVSAAMLKQVERNRGRNRNVMGYKIRIYFDNAQNARTVSLQIVDTFSYYYPDIPVYRTYVNPYFKVTVGDFRTKSDAMRFLEAIRPKYPTVFLVREPISTI